MAKTLTLKYYRQGRQICVSVGGAGVMKFSSVKELLVFFPGSKVIEVKR
jgi:hypothetical protein